MYCGIFKIRCFRCKLIFKSYLILKKISLERRIGYGWFFYLSFPIGLAWEIKNRIFRSGPLSIYPDHTHLHCVEFQIDFWIALVPNLIGNSCDVANELYVLYVRLLNAKLTRCSREPYAEFFSTRIHALPNRQDCAIVSFYFWFFFIAPCLNEVFIDDWREPVAALLEPTHSRYFFACECRNTWTCDPIRVQSVWLILPNACMHIHMYVCKYYMYSTVSSCAYFSHSHSSLFVFVSVRMQRWRWRVWFMASRFVIDASLTLNFTRFVEFYVYVYVCTFI